MIIEPASVDEVATALARASAAGHRVAIRGSGTKQGWGATPAPVDVVLSTLKLNALLAHRHGDLTATVQAGARLVDVNRALARHQQWLPLDPPCADRATIGGIVAANDSGPRRHRYGAPRDLIIGVDFVRPDGVAAKAGGIVVKNVAGYDIARLLTGSFGSLAVIVSATFKLFPLPQASRTVVVDCVDLNAAGALLEALRARQLTPTAIELQAQPARILVRFETIEAGAAQQAATVVDLIDSADARATIAQGVEEAQLWAEHDSRPWNGEGAVIKIALLPDAVVPTVKWLADAADGTDYDAIGRAGVGVLLARIAGDATVQARVLEGLRERLPPERGSAVLVRGSDELRSLVDGWGPIGDAVALMSAVKHQFDPKGTLQGLGIGD